MRCKGKNLCMTGRNTIAESEIVLQLSTDFGVIYEVFSVDFLLIFLIMRSEESGAHCCLTNLLSLRLLSIRIELLKRARKRKHRNPHIHTLSIPTSSHLTAGQHLALKWCFSRHFRAYCYRLTYSIAGD